MVSPLFFYQLTLFVLVWLFVMLYVIWSKSNLPRRAVCRLPRQTGGGNEPYAVAVRSTAGRSTRIRRVFYTS